MPLARNRYSVFPRDRAGCRFHPRCPYATEKCKQERPALLPLKDGRNVACHYPLDGAR